MSDKPYRLFGMTQSYFTRKLSAYLDHKGIPYLFRRFAGANPEVLASGWSGGVPAMQTPDGEFMWDSSAVIHHLEFRFPERSVLPPDPVQRFVCYLLEDVADEWLYRPAVGSRWFFEENTRHGGWELAREATCDLPVSCDQAFLIVSTHVRGSCPPLGTTQENIQSWMDEVVRPWFRVLGTHLETRPYLFGDRPSLADFALFGGNAAHFVNDPVCRRWVDQDGPAIATHTHRLLEPQDQPLGNWNDTPEIPETLIALLADLGRLYLPWVSRATVDGSAELVFESGQRIEIGATDFLKDARATLLARYAEHRSTALDAVLERAGILSYFGEYRAQAGAIPDYEAPPRPDLNRPFPPPDVP